MENNPLFSSFTPSYLEHCIRFVSSASEQLKKSSSVLQDEFRVLRLF